jgi:pimeloyl-ACP methyl ester carboxylesterase
LVNQSKARAARQARELPYSCSNTGRRFVMDVALSADLVEIRAGSARLYGDLVIPPRPRGVVIFAHGSGSSRFSRRNRKVAETLQVRGYATLLLDLLTPEEESVDAYTAEYRFDLPLLASRVCAAAEWAATMRPLADLPIGLFGASTGGGAALMAAADRPDLVCAVVSRGGRPDLADEALPRVHAPTLLIVGGADRDVIDLNRQAMHRMLGPVELRIIPGATHLFEEPGALEEVEREAGDWFERCFNADAQARRRVG